MSCCGRSGQPPVAPSQGSSSSQTSRRPGGTTGRAGAAPGQQSLPPRPIVRFEYTGATALTAVGGVTRSVYRFSGPGVQVLVDPRDAPSLRAVPQLRRVG